MRRMHLALCLLFAVALSAASAQPAAPTQTAEYFVKLAEYDAARAAYQIRATPYWNAVKAKRAQRFAKRRAHGEIAPEVPVVADFLQAAAKLFDFVPERPANEIEFKRAYARVASAAGLTKDQAVRVYAFEATGNGAYDLEAGREFDPNAPAITTALGYNQLLSTNSVELLAEQGRQFIETLRGRAAEASGERKA